MYLRHFGLGEAPFRITPHTDFFFSGANRGATLEALIYAITHDEGIVKVSGEVGSGKTMLCRVLMERLPEKVVTIYLANPSLSRDDILYALADELEIPVADSARATLLLRALQERLIELYSAGRQVVVLIDEAHAMPPETLEEIRLLSNLESNRHKLLQLVLFGQTELNEILARPEMRQLKDRITHNFTLEPLVREDIASYLAFRMRAAGYRGPDVFGLAAVRLIDKASSGLTRRINILADKSLLAVFAEGGYQVLPRHVKAAVRDSEFPLPRNSARLAGVGAAMAAAVALALGAGWWLARPQVPESLPPSAPGPTPSQGSTTPATTLPPSTAAPQPVVPATPATVAPADSAPTAAVAGAPANPQPAPPVPPSPAQTSQAAPAPSPATATMPAPGVQAAANHGRDAPPGLDTEPFGARTRAKLGETRAWLQKANDDAWVLQILITGGAQAGEVERLLAQVESGAEYGELRAYAVPVQGKTRIGVLYGEFRTREAAAAAVASLPSPLKAQKPFPRQVRRLR
ncbi:MAG TPA: AAA family ATPase [Rhodocyclaceae bacterium]|nr:AAA family ATPase [Rhodocyclaceae bacterium]